jgi:hypothetical protein
MLTSNCQSLFLCAERLRVVAHPPERLDRESAHHEAAHRCQQKGSNDEDTQKGAGHAALNSGVRSTVTPMQRSYATGEAMTLFQSGLSEGLTEQQSDYSITLLRQTAFVHTEEIR